MPREVDGGLSVVILNIMASMNIYLISLIGIISCGLIVIALVIRTYVNQNKKKVALEEAKTEFLSLVAHYFLTPLAIIRGNISELMTPESTSWSRSQIFDRYLNIETSSTKLLILLENIMTISAIDQGSLKISIRANSVINLIDDCIASFHHLTAKQQISIIFDRPEKIEIDMAKFDIEKVRQAIINILDNSVKFTKPGGVVKVTLRNEDNKYRIDIADSGVGIDKKEMPKLFTRFHRGTSYLNLDYEGVGLGLYISKYLIEANRGRMLISSERNRGTCVTILLPK